MFGEKDLIFLGAALIKTNENVDCDEAILHSVKLYEKIFGHVSDDNLRFLYSYNDGE